MKRIYIAASVIILCITVFIIYVIPHKSNDGIIDEKTEVKQSTVVDDTLRINIQPLDGIKSVERYVENFTELYLKPIGLKKYKVNVLPHKISPDSAYNDTHTRYRAIKLMNFLHANTHPNSFTIGITDKDISTSIHGADDYGILGISYLGYKRRACITSTYRLKYKKDIWKLMAHEFTHGFFNQRHCKIDDEHCIMQDAKGKSPRFEIKEKLCSECSSDITRKIKQKSDSNTK